MKTIVICFVLMLLFAASSPAQIDDIVNKHIAAIGGRDVIGRIHSIYMETSISTMGNVLPGKITILDGKGYRSETQYDTGTLIDCVTDKGGWRVNPFVDPAKAPLTTSEYNSARGAIEIGGELFDYAAKGSKAELMGRDERGLYKIKLTTREGVVTIYFIDPKTYFIEKRIDYNEIQGQQMERVNAYYDYIKTGVGFFVPQTIDTTLGQFLTMTKLQKIEFNKPVDPAIFEMPK